MFTIINGMAHDTKLKEYIVEPGRPPLWYFECSCGESSIDSISTRKNAIHWLMRHNETGEVGLKHD